MYGAILGDIIGSPFEEDSGAGLVKEILSHTEVMVMVPP